MPPRSSEAFEICLRNGRLKRVEPDPQKIHQEIQTAIIELCRARASHAEHREEDCLTQSCFALSRILRVLLERLGYRDRNLYSMVIALDHLYVEPGRLAPHLVEILKLGKEQKELIQEGSRCRQGEARLVLAGAEDAMVLARAEFDLGAIPELDSSADGPREKAD